MRKMPVAPREKGLFFDPVGRNGWKENGPYKWHAYFLSKVKNGIAREKKIVWKMDKNSPFQKDGKVFITGRKYWLRMGENENTFQYPVDGKWETALCYPLRSRLAKCSWRESNWFDLIWFISHSVNPYKVRWHRTCHDTLHNIKHKINAVSIYIQNESCRDVDKT
jgi:hypothetical protein